MRTYFQKLEHNSYLPANTSGHGFEGWLYTEQPPLSVPFSDSKILAMTYAAAQTLGSAVVGPIVNTIAGLTSLLQNQGDMNRDTPDRDSKLGMFQIPIHTHQGVRNTPREFVLNTMASGAPLDFLPNSLVTKVLFDNSSGTPVATGVEYMRGQSLYQAGMLLGTALSLLANADDCQILDITGPPSIRQLCTPHEKSSSRLVRRLYSPLICPDD